MVKEQDGGALGSRFAQIVDSQTTIDLPTGRVFMDKKPTEGAFGFLDVQNSYGTTRGDILVREIGALHRANPSENVVTVSIREKDPTQVAKLAIENVVPYSLEGTIRLAYHLLDNDTGGVKEVTTYRRGTFDAPGNIVAQTLRGMGEKDTVRLTNLAEGIETGEIFNRQGVDVFQVKTETFVHKPGPQK